MKPTAERGAELLHSDVDLVSGLDRLGFDHADRANFRVGERRPRQHRVVGGNGILAEDVRNGDRTLIHRDMCEHSDAGHVADRPDVGGCLDPLVHRDELARAVDPGGIQPQAVEHHLSSGRDEDAVGGHLGSVIQRRRHGAVVARELLHPHSGDDADAFGLERLGDDAGRDGILAGKDALPPLDDRDVDTEAGEHLPELAADGAAAQDEERSRELLGLDGVAGRPVIHVDEPWDRRDRRL